MSKRIQRAERLIAQVERLLAMVERSVAEGCISEDHYWCPGCSGFLHESRFAGTPQQGKPVATSLCAQSGDVEKVYKL